MLTFDFPSPQQLLTIETPDFVMDEKQDSTELSPIVINDRMLSHSAIAGPHANPPLFTESDWQIFKAIKQGKFIDTEAVSPILMD